MCERGYGFTQSVHPSTTVTSAHLHWSVVNPHRHAPSLYHIHLHIHSSTSIYRSTPLLLHPSTTSIQPSPSLHLIHSFIHPLHPIYLYYILSLKNVCTDTTYYAWINNKGRLKRGWWWIRIPLCRWDFVFAKELGANNLPADHDKLCIDSPDSPWLWHLKNNRPGTETFFSWIGGD